jgi:membrane-bound lytic murein transglycosylase A
MRIAEKVPNLFDSFDVNNFKVSLEKNIELLNTQKKEFLTFGPHRINTLLYKNELQKLLEVDNEKFYSYLRENYDFLEVYGNDDWGNVFITGYYEPHVTGSRIKTLDYDTPLYRAPEDLEKIRPFYTREEIDQLKVLDGQGLELAWLTPLDAFFIQIQGSGVVNFIDGGIKRFGYAGQNGHPYVPIGKFLLDKIKKEEMSMQKIKNYLGSISKDEMHSYLIKNPSYVFFTELSGEAKTASGAEVIPGRTIATDSRFFPKGALAYLEVFEPVYTDIDDTNNLVYQFRPRFVFDHDTGGAIKGGGRVDLYFGSGMYHALKAGGMKERGKLYYLVPKVLILEKNSQF